MSEQESDPNPSSEPSAPHVPLGEALSRAAAELARRERAGRAPAAPTSRAEPPRRKRAATKHAPPVSAPPAETKAPATPPADPAPPSSTLHTDVDALPAEPEHEVRWGVRWSVAALGLAAIASLIWFVGTLPSRDRAEVTPIGTPPVAAPAVPAAPPRVQAPPPRDVELVVRDAAPAHAGEVVHTVVAGDTLWAIAQRYVHNPWAYAELARNNHIDDPDVIQPGDRVRIVFRR